jgi:gamma-glutamyltranspeptidase/glutathione hydrolase
MSSNTVTRQGITSASAGRGRGGAVACGHEVTAAAAREVLEDGGNAFDAAVAGVCAACVAEPVLCSLGGGGYLLARTAGHSTLAYDFFPDTPLSRLPWGEVDLHPIDADFGTTTQRFHIGLGAVATPGVPAGLSAIHRELGRLPMQRLVEPAVRAARTGVVVNAFQAGIFRIVAPIYLATPEARRTYGEDAASLPQEGQVFRQPELADSLEQLASRGPEFFYDGEFGRRLVEACRGNGGQLGLEDLRRYAVVRRQPLCFDYQGARILTNPPPSRGGILVAFALALLTDTEWRDRAGWLATLVEAMRLTNQARAEEGDALLDDGLLERYGRELRARPGCNRGTTHLSILDDEGNVAAVSLSNGEGCGHLLPGTGIMLNNMLGEEDINPEGFQAWQPGTRMASMMAPTLLEHAGSLAALGSGGSNRIRSAILQVICNLVDFDMDLEQAVAASRIHVERELLSLEHGFAPAELEALAASGLELHQWPGRSLFFGGVHVVRSGPTGAAACGDARRGGVGLVTVRRA